MGTRRHRGDDPPETPRRRRPEPEPEGPPGPEGRWLERLLQEWEDECGEPPWYPEPVAEPEPFGAWAERIAEEHRRRHPRPPPPAPKRGPPRAPPAPWDESRLFRQRQREKEAQVGRARARRGGGGDPEPAAGGDPDPPKSPVAPPRPPENSGLLRFEDVPWPCPGGDAEAMASAALRGVPAPPAGPPGPYRRLLRRQRALWHPDRFARLWGGRLRPPDRPRALAAATALAQALNRRADAAKGQ